MPSLTRDQQQIAGRNNFGPQTTIYGANWSASNFTPSVSGNLNKVYMVIHKVGTPVGPLTVGIYATDSGGKPTGTALATQSILDSAITDYALLTVTFSSPPALTASTKYAFVLSNGGGSSGNGYRPYWTSYASSEDFYGSSTTDYSSTNSGSTWSPYSAADLTFVTEMSASPAAPSVDQFCFCDFTEFEFITTNTTRFAQTFVPSFGGWLKQIKVHLYRVDSQTGGNVVFAIRAVDGNNKPTGSDLASQTVTDSTLGTGTNTSALYVTFATPAALQSGTTYALEIRFLAAGGSARYQLGTWGQSDLYASGRAWKSSDGGSTWGNGAYGTIEDLGFATYMQTPTQTIQSDARIKSTLGQTLANDQILLIADSSSPISGVYIINYPGGGYTDFREAQGFTPSVTGNLRSVTLPVIKSSVSIGDLTVSIYATLSGKPTGSALATQVVSQALVPQTGTGATPAPITVIFDSPAALTSGVTYAIVLSTSAVANNYSYNWFGYYGNNTVYSGGISSYSTNGGSSWNAGNPHAFAFVTTMTTAVTTPGLDQFIMGGQQGNAPEYRVDTAGQYRAQTFISVVPAPLKKVRVYLVRADGQTTGTVTFVIKAVDGNGKPTGSALATQIVADSSLPDTTDNPVTEVTFATPATLVNGTQYALVLQFNNVDSTHKYYIGHDYTNDDYANGQRWDSADSGATWASNANSKDLLLGTFMLELTTTSQTINSNADVSGTTSRTVNSNATVKLISAKTITADSTIRLTSAKTRLSDATILATAIKTILANSIIRLTTAHTINANTTIQATPSRTIPSGATVQITTPRTIFSDAFCGQLTMHTITAAASVGATMTRMIDSNAFCGERTTKIIDADAHVWATIPRTLNADAHILVTTQRTVNSTATIRQTTVKTLVTDSVILATAFHTAHADATIFITSQHTLNANTLIQGLDTKVILSDAIISGVTQQLICADAQVVLTATQTINAAARIWAATLQMLNAQAFVVQVTVQTISSSAVIIKREPKIQLYVVI